MLTKPYTIVQRLLILLMPFLWVSFAHAQDEPISVEVEVSRSKVYLGDELIYQVIIRGSENPPIPMIEFPDSVRTQYAGQSSQSFSTMRVVNGRSRMVTDQHFRFQYTLSPTETGSMFIPSPVFMIDGQRYEGHPIEFEVIYPTLSDIDDVEMRIDRTEIYLNETVEVQCSWWIGDRTTEFELGSSIIPESFVIRGITLQAGNSQQFGLKINGQKMVSVLVDDHHLGRDMKKLVFRFTITPTQLGDFMLGPIRPIFTRQSGTGQNYRAYSESESTTITVLEVPGKGKPDGYRGAIGTFELNAFASNTTVNVGDPIELTLEISGDEPLAGIKDAPPLTDLHSFETQFKASSEGWREQLPRRAGVRVFGTTIRALNEHVDQIPPIVLHSFDPETGSYTSHLSTPIPLTVHPVNEITLSDAYVAGGLARSSDKPPTDRVELTRAMPELWAHASPEDLLAQPRFSIDHALTRPVWITSVALGPTLFAFSILTVRVRHTRTSDAKLIRRAWRTSKSLDRQGRHAQALRVYIGCLLNINEDAVTAQDAQLLLINHTDAADVCECLNADERTGFNSATSEQEESPHGFVCRPSILRDIHRQLKRSKGYSS